MSGFRAITGPNEISDIVAGGVLTQTATGTLAVNIGSGLISTSGALAVSLTATTASLGSDVNLTSVTTFFDGPSVAQGTTGIWFASGQVTCIDSAGLASILGKLWDGSTVVDSALVTVPAANERVVMALSGYISSPVGNLRISVQDGTSANGKILFNASGLSKDSTITAFRIG